MNTPELISRTKTFDGWLDTYKHASQACHCAMRFSIYLPPQAEQGPVAVLYWLSGLTCTEENFMVKAGAQRYAAELGIALVAPDTSPRNTGIPGEEDDWDFGTGAGFYVDATQAPWSNYYHMYTYITQELPELIEAYFPVVAGRKSVSGHSMGGHGALIVALKNLGAYRSVSAFAPVCAPMQCPWGKKAFTGYLGSNQDTWKAYDATCLIEQAAQEIPLLIDQGDADEFLEEQLKPELLQKVCAVRNYPLQLRMQPGYDHSYYFIATFIGEHLRYHAKALKGDT